ncbi:MAG: fumarate hydratase C-terminal domain-containing protein, partial [Coriobacteriales bacterium]|nr:fumarate hydratase C-terminal domain-containing protein [Coriobacteriales bacterium]
MTQPIRLDLPAARAKLCDLHAGDAVVLYGSIYTMRDAGHRRALAFLDEHGELPF